jgi:membrane protease subunit HflK
MEVLSNLNNFFKDLFSQNSNFDGYNGGQNDSPRRNPSKRVSALITVVTVMLLVLVVAFNSSYQVKEQEQAIILTFGKPTGIASSGLHFKIPFMQQIKKVDTTIKGLSIGYNQDSGQNVESEALMITGDYNFINIDFFIEYKVADPIKALYASQNPISILKNICQSSIRTIIGSSNVDDVLTTGKAEIQAKIKDHVLEKLAVHDIGIQLVNISIQDAEPPTEEVMEAFKQVETAKQSKDTAINNANKYRNEKLPAARAEIDKIMQEAESTKARRTNEAIGQVARFNKMYEEYIKFPEITKKRMFFETMEEIMPGLEVIIDNGDGSTQKILPLKSFTGGNDQ